MTKNGLEIFITILLLSSLILILLVYNNPREVFTQFDTIYINWGKKDIISSQDNMFMIYKNILLMLSFFSFTCLILNPSFFKKFLIFNKSLISSGL